MFSLALDVKFQICKCYCKKIHTWELYAKHSPYTEFHTVAYRFMQDKPFAHISIPYKEKN